MTGATAAPDHLPASDAGSGQYRDRIGRLPRTRSKMMVKTSNKRSPRRTDNKTNAAVTAEAETPAAANLEESREGGPTMNATDKTAQPLSADDGSTQPTDDTTDTRSPAPGATAPSKLKPSTKLDTVVTMLGRENGATVAEIIAATNWQAHSVRGFLSGTVKKKLGLTLAKTKAADGQLIYRIVPDAIEETEDERETANSSDVAAGSGIELTGESSLEEAAAFGPPAEMDLPTGGEDHGGDLADDNGAPTITPRDEA